jgi:hypothetical protein
MLNASGHKGKLVSRRSSEAGILNKQSVRQPLAHWNRLLTLLKKASVVQKSFCLSIFATNQNLVWFEQYKVRFIVVILSINRNCEHEALDQSDVLLWVVSINAHLFCKALYE